MLVLLMAALTWGPHLTSYKTDIIVGQSMEPTIPLWSVIVVEPVAPTDIRKGDIITYEQPDVPGRKVTHRVHRVEQMEDGSPAFVTKGDNNNVRDSYRVSYADTAWRVKAHVPHVGWVIAQSQTRLARVALVVVPVLVLLVQLLRMIWRNEDDENADADDEQLDDTGLHEPWWDEDRVAA
jgi:signal peptidase